MNNIVLYCKSFNRDVQRCKRLFDSIQKHNKDNIPFYISVPQEDTKLFVSVLGQSGYTLLRDDEILGENIAQGWNTQQIVKMMFWKTTLCKNYVVVDSDSYFIRDFYESDFLVYGDVPYTVMHEQKDLFSWTAKHINELGFDPQKSFAECRTPVQSLFDRKGRVYDFGPVPVIWSSKVWQTMEEEYLKPNNLTFSGLIGSISSEFTWYGEWLLVRKPVEIWPIEPIFKVFHYSLQYHQHKVAGYTPEHFSKNYLGLVLQSAGGCPIEY